MGWAGPPGKVAVRAQVPGPPLPAAAVAWPGLARRPRPQQQQAIEEWGGSSKERRRVVAIISPRTAPPGSRPRPALAKPTRVARRLLVAASRRPACACRLGFPFLGWYDSRAATRRNHRGARWRPAGHPHGHCGALRPSRGRYLGAGIRGCGCHCRR